MNGVARGSCVLALLLTSVVGSCTSDDNVPATDDAGVDLGPAPDLSAAETGPVPDLSPVGPDQGGPDLPSIVSEQEPNNGSTPTEYNTIAPPALIQGAIGEPDDIDIFAFQAQAGDRLVVEIHTDGTLQPHLAINDPQNQLPPGPAVSAGAGDVMAEYYVVEPGQYMIFVRDQRNVGNSQQVGGPNFGYTMSVKPLSRPPLSAAIGQAQSGTLSPPGTIRVFAFAAQQDDELQIAVEAVPPSDLDARLTLYHPGQQSWHGTNEDPLSSSALLLGSMPFAGTYHAIVENVSGETANLDFSFAVTGQ